MQKILILVLSIILTACATSSAQQGGVKRMQLTESEVEGLSFVKFNDQPFAVFDNVNSIEVAYRDVDADKIKIYDTLEDGRYCKSCSATGIDADFGGKLVVKQRAKRIILLRRGNGKKSASKPVMRMSASLAMTMAGLSAGRPIEESDVVIICGEKNSPCAVTNGCGGDFTDGDSTEDILNSNEICPNLF